MIHGSRSFSSCNKIKCFKVGNKETVSVVKAALDISGEKR